MKLQLPSSVASQQDLQALLVDIHTYAKWYSHNSLKKRLRVKRIAEAPVISAAATELIHDWSVVKPLDVHTLDELIAALQAYGQSAPSLTIVLAAPPTGGLKKTLVDWCRKHIAPNILISFEYNSTLLGGMVIRYGSHIFDWSFRRQILASSARFPEVLRHV